MANVVADDDAEMAEGAVGGAVGGAEGGDDVTQLSKVAKGKRSAFLSSLLLQFSCHNQTAYVSLSICIFCLCA